MIDFAQGGKPLDDKRFINSGKNDKLVQYRMWADSFTGLIPKGQSISKPLNSENVQVNLKAFGEINKGFFNPPTVEFRNTENGKLFDRFSISIMRDYFPDDEDLTLEEMGIKIVELEFIINVVFEGVLWQHEMHTLFLRRGENIYQSMTQFFTTDTIYSSQGLLPFSIDFWTDFNLNISGTHNLGTLILGNTSLDMSLKKALINRGSSEYLYNPIFNNSLSPIEFFATDIRIVRGWA